MSTSRVKVGGGLVDCVTKEQAMEAVWYLVKIRRPAYVTFCNVHLAMTADGDSRLADAVRASDLCLPDGAPVAWFMSRARTSPQARIAGPDFMEALCSQCAERGVSIGLFGSRPEVLQQLATRLSERYANLSISYSCSPPFSGWSEGAESEFVSQMNASGAAILFVGLGCPKQELWMARNARRVNAVMLGVGAAFDFQAGIIPRAPAWMRCSGLEWLHRLYSEPRRLWWRYTLTNTAFILWVIQHWRQRRKLSSARDVSETHP